MPEEVRGVADYSANKSEFNRISFIVQQAIREQVNTCLPCKVVGAENGYVDVLPLVTQISGKGEAVPPTTVHHIPYMRYHGGVCAVKLEPVVGDLGLMVISDKDCTSIRQGMSEPVQPASYRGTNLANGFYIGGFLNQSPTCVIELKQDNSIEITASGGVKIKGDVTVDGDVVASNISLTTHKHGGVESGNSDTAGPK